MDKYASSAPVHLAWPKANNCPTDLLKSLLDAGHIIKRGRFGRRENRRMWKNWHRFCRFYPEFSDPFVAFSKGQRPKTKVSIKNKHVDDLHDKRLSRRLKKKFKKLNFPLRLAYKLDKRLVCDIYWRAKKEILNRAYAYSNRAALPDEKVEKVIKYLFERNKPIKEVCSKLNISPTVVESIKRHPKKFNSFHWKAEDDIMLESAIAKQFPESDPRSIPTYQINWVQACEEMHACGYDFLVKRQVYKRWIRLNPEMLNYRHKRIFGEVDQPEQPIEATPDSDI